ncbi:SAV_6107 family HEPN domain-containing protein [Luteimicrobium sp. NPDC057192]|uniref:SAV_6107 family HEPN domain-containing protein n=1 Tax=Luteimicrobium sp. NPDC057192 TaxID=3346042 RepID=UPI00362E41FA
MERSERVPSRHGRAAAAERTTAPAPAPLEALRLLSRADHELASAYAAPDPAERFVHAHLAALRAAAAVVALRGRPSGRRTGRSVWALVEVVEPALAPWSVYFAGGARTRAAIDAGRFDVVDAARADELVRCAEDFRDEVGMLVDPTAAFSLLPGSRARAS